MNRSVAAACTAVCIASGSALAASPFDGTWRMDLENATLPAKPVVITVRDGSYACASCVPPVGVKADGADHAVTDNPYHDTLAVTLTGANTMSVVEKKAGRVVDDETRTLSQDGNTMSFDETSTSASGVVTTAKGSLVRVAAAPAGAGPMSGGWRLAHVSSSGNARVMTYKLAGNALSFSMPTGEAFTATVDGPEAPFTGDSGVDTVSIKRIDATTLEETDKKDGKIVFIGRMTVAPGSGTMAVSYNNVRAGRSIQMKAYRE